MSRQQFVKVEPGIRVRVVIDDFTDPWRPAETVLMLHGMGQNLEAWRGWVPYLARNYRVVRFDTRGFGKSTPPPEDAVWSTERLVADIDAVMDFVGCSSAHFVGAQSGGSLVFAFAARRPERVRSIVAVTPMVVGTPAVPGWLKQIETEGIQAWARATMAGRLGSGATKEQVDYWADNVQGKTPLSTLRGYLRWAPQVDVRPDLAHIKCRTLVMTTAGSNLRSVESVKASLEKLQNAELMVIEGDAWAPAAAYPDVCGPAAARFLASQCSEKTGHGSACAPSASARA